MKTDYENLKLEDLEEGEIKFEINKDAFKVTKLHCTDCNILMKKTVVKYKQFPYKCFECPRCHKKHLSGDQAEKFDKIIIK